MQDLLKNIETKKLYLESNDMSVEVCYGLFKGAMRYAIKVNGVVCSLFGEKGFALEYRLTKLIEEFNLKYILWRQM